jgi:hypothetical protein
MELPETRYTAQGVAQTVMDGADKDRPGSFYDGVKWACADIIARCDRADQMACAMDAPGLLTAREAELTRLVEIMLEEDPAADAADGGVTVLDVWRKDAKRVLGIG